MNSKSRKWQTKDKDRFFRFRAERSMLTLHEPQKLPRDASKEWDIIFSNSWHNLRVRNYFHSCKIMTWGKILEFLISFSEFSYIVWDWSIGHGMWIPRNVYTTSAPAVVASEEVCCCCCCSVSVVVVLVGKESRSSLCVYVPPVVWKIWKRRWWVMACGKASTWTFHLSAALVNNE